MSKAVAVLLVVFVGAVSAAYIDWDLEAQVDDEPFFLVKRGAKPEKVNQAECLGAHNTDRKKHGAPPLVWDAGLAKQAQAYAMKLASSGTFAHDMSVRGKQGENLAVQSGAPLSCKKATKMWHDEVKDYDFSHPGFNMKTGHFTQEVWKSTKRLGVGIASNGNRWVVVARYTPPGNFMGQFKGNVA